MTFTNRLRGVLLFFWITVNSYYIFLREEEDSLLRLLTTRFQVPIPVQNGRLFRDPGPNEQSFAAEYTPKPWATQESSPNVLRPWSNAEPSIPKTLSIQEPSDETAPYQRPLPIRRPLINAMNHKSGNMRQLPQKVLPPLPPKVQNSSSKPKLKPRGIPDPELWISEHDSSAHTPSPKQWKKEETAPEEIPYREPWVRKQSQEETPYREPWIDESGEEIAYEKTWKTHSSEYDNAYQETWSSQETAPEDVRWKSSEEDASYDQLWTSRLTPTEDGYFDPQSVVKLPLQTDC